MENMDWIVLFVSCLLGEILEIYYVHETRKIVKVRVKNGIKAFFGRVLIALAIGSISYITLGIRNEAVASYIGLTAWGSTAYLVGLVLHKHELQNTKYGSFTKGILKGLNTLEVELRDRERQATQQRESSLYHFAADKIMENRRVLEKILSEFK